MAKAEIAKAAILCDNGDGIARSDAVSPCHTTVVEVKCQKNGSVSSVSQSRWGSLHICKGCMEGVSVPDIVDGGGFDTELGDGEGNLAVFVSRVRNCKQIV